MHIDVSTMVIVRNKYSTHHVTWLCEPDTDPKAGCKRLHNEPERRKCAKIGATFLRWFVIGIQAEVC